MSESLSPRSSKTSRTWSTSVEVAPGLISGNHDDLPAEFVERLIEGDRLRWFSTLWVLDGCSVPFLAAEIADGSAGSVESAIGRVVVDEDGGAVFEELDVHLGQEPVLRRGGETFHGLLRVDIGTASMGDRGGEFEFGDLIGCSEVGRGR